MYSFDVYDTLITRVVAEPKGIFYIMKNILENTNIVNREVVSNFVHIREYAEGQARIQKDSEVTLENIYKSMSSNFGLSESEIEKLIELEIQCEITNSRGITCNIERLKKLVEQGEKVVLISDMYLSEEVLKQIFEKIEPVLTEIPLYVSSKYGVTKESGLLYVLVRDKENVSYAEWTHIGDNVVSDVNIPELYGISTERYCFLEKTALEEKIYSLCKSEDAVIAQIVSGLSKISFLDMPSYGYKMGYCCMAVVLFSYVSWVLKMALQKDLKRLYFIARDGYILKKIADQIIKAENYDLMSYYLYGSRKAWNPQNVEEKELLCFYLKQEILSKEGRFALIDTQGSGNSVDNLAKLIKKEIPVFYYVLREAKGEKNIDPYVYSNFSGGDMMEAFCRAPHGATIGYRKENDLVSPILSEWNENVWLQAELFECIRGVECFCSDYLEVRKHNNLNIGLFGFSEKLLRYCVESPDLELANFIGNIPHDTANISEQYQYAPKLTQKEIYQIEVERTTEDLAVFYSGNELQYSYMRLNELEKKYLEGCKREFFLKKQCKKKLCVKVVVYAYGKYGKELVHRLYYADSVELIGVVDVNYQRYKAGEINVSGVKELRTMEYDYIVISLDNKRAAMLVKKMLESAGIKGEKILFRNEFVNRYLLEENGEK